MNAEQRPRRSSRVLQVAVASVCVVMVAVALVMLFDFNPLRVPEHETLYQQALALDGNSRTADSIALYRRAARAGSGKAALRLAQIYDRGAAGVSRDYSESLQWYETARQLGERVETCCRR